MLNASFLKRTEIAVLFLKTSKRSENRSKFSNSIQERGMIRLVVVTTRCLEILYASCSKRGGQNTDTCLNNYIMWNTIVLNTNVADVLLVGSEINTLRIYCSGNLYVSLSKVDNLFVRVRSGIYNNNNNNINLFIPTGNKKVIH